ncbi:hypothetical protein BC831DRAFT_441642 [Entophlyctis helioformis]|nr:hypothetical protein BC831DRAFT_441642 [Entophlyctis helioformis]
MAAPSVLDIRMDPVKGRCFFTKTPVSKGQVVLEARAYAFIVDSESVGIVCSGCHRPPAFVEGQPVAQTARPLLPYGCHVPCAPSAPSAAPSASASGRGPTASPVAADGQDAIGVDGSPSGRANRPDATNAPPSAECCGLLRYCSPECARTDYDRFHQYECAAMRQWLADPVHSFTTSSGYIQDLTRLLMRTITRIGIEQSRQRQQSATSAMPDAGSAPDTKDSDWILPYTLDDHLWTLCDNVRAFAPDLIQSYTPVAALLASFASLHPLRPVLPAIDDATYEYISSLQTPRPTRLEATMTLLICKEECNSFGVYTFAYHGKTAERQSYGLALYTDAVFFNHACHPNIGHVTRALAKHPQAFSVNVPVQTTATRDEHPVSTMVFYATQDLAAGQEALIAYLPLESGIKRRQATTSECFFFECRCQRCVYELGRVGPDDADKDGMVDECVQEFGLHLCRKDGCKGWLVPSKASRQDSAKDLMAGAGAADALGTVAAMAAAVTSELSAHDCSSIQSAQWVCEGCRDTRPIVS